MPKNINDPERFKEILNILAQIESDNTVPKNTRGKIKEVMAILSVEPNDNIKLDQAKQGLDEIAEDPNIPVYTRTQVWNVVSALESLWQKYLYIGYANFKV